MQATARALVVTGAALDVAAIGTLAALTWKVAGRPEPLKPRESLTAIGASTAAVVGALLILGAIVIHVLDDLIDRYLLGSTECVAGRVAEAVTDGLETLTVTATSTATATRPVPLQSIKAERGRT